MALRLISRNKFLLSEFTVLTSKIHAFLNSNNLTYVTSSQLSLSVEMNSNEFSKSWRIVISGSFGISKSLQNWVRLNNLIFQRHFFGRFFLTSGSNEGKIRNNFFGIFSFTGSRFTTAKNSLKNHEFLTEELVIKRGKSFTEFSKQTLFWFSFSRPGAGPRDALIGWIQNKTTNQKLCLHFTQKYLFQFVSCDFQVSNLWFVKLWHERFSLWQKHTVCKFLNFTACQIFTWNQILVIIRAQKLRFWPFWRPWISISD